MILMIIWRCSRWSFRIAACSLSALRRMWRQAPSMIPIGSRTVCGEAVCQKGLIRCPKVSTPISTRILTNTVLKYRAVKPRSYALQGRFTKAHPLLSLTSLPLHLTRFPNTIFTPNSTALSEQGLQSIFRTGCQAADSVMR